jgi:acyl-CoA thioesterase
MGADRLAGYSRIRAVTAPVRPVARIPMTDFDRDTALEPHDDGTFIGEVADGWWTPRGPLGGYVMALLLRGITDAVAAPERQVRSLTVNFLRTPAAGPITVRPQVERAGRSVTTATGRLEQDGELMALAIASYSGPWPGPELVEAPMPSVAPPDGKADPARDLSGGPRPPFAERLSMQPRFGDPLFSGSPNAEVGGWLGLKEERPIDALTLVVLADAWFPSQWPRLSKLMPAPTIELSVYFRAPLPLPHSLLLGRFTSTAARDGFFEEDGQLWSPDGTLVAQSRQLGLLIDRG